MHRYWDDILPISSDLEYYSCATKVIHEAMTTTHVHGSTEQSQASYRKGRHESPIPISSTWHTVIELDEIHFMRFI